MYHPSAPAPSGPAGGSPDRGWSGWGDTRGRADGAIQEADIIKVEFMLNKYLKR